MNIGNGHNGVLWLEIEVKGKAAHGAQPDKGINAFEKTAELVTALQRVKRNLKSPERAFKLPDGSDRYPTLNIGGTFRGTDGDKVNTVPASVTFSIDRRITPNEELEFAELELREAISGGVPILPRFGGGGTRDLAHRTVFDGYRFANSTSLRRCGAYRPLQSTPI